MNRIPIALVVLFFLGAACSGASSEGAIQTAIAQTESASVPLPAVTQSPSSTPSPLPTNTIMPTPAPTETTAASFGTYSNPVPFGQEAGVLMDNRIAFSVKVSQAIRGDEAWAKIMDENMFNEPAPEGKDYLLIYVIVNYPSSTTTDVLEFSPGTTFSTLSKGNVLSGYFFINEPEPELKVSLFPGGTAEGWIVKMAFMDDPRPLLIAGDATSASAVFFTLFP